MVMGIRAPIVGPAHTCKGKARLVETCSVGGPHLLEHEATRFCAGLGEIIITAQVCETGAARTRPEYVLWTNRKLIEGPLSLVFLLIGREPKNLLESK